MAAKNSAGALSWKRVAGAPALFPKEQKAELWHLLFGTVGMKGKGWIITSVLAAGVGAVVWWGVQPGKKTRLPRAVEKAAPYIAPLVKIQQIRIRTLSRDAMAMEATVGIRNKMPVPFRIDSLRYTTYIGGKMLSDASRSEPLSLAKSDSTSFTLPLVLNLAALKAYEGQDYTVRATLFTDLPLTSDSALTITMNLRWLVLKLPEVSLDDVGKVDPGLRRTGLVATFTMQNPNAVAFRMKDIRYTMAVDDDREVVSEGVLGETVDLPAHGSDNISLPLELRTRTGLKMVIREKARRYHTTMTCTLEAEGLGSTQTTMHIDGRLKDLSDKD